MEKQLQDVDKWEHLFNIAGFKDIAWGIALLFFTLYIVKDDEINPSKIIMVQMVSYQVLFIWIPTLFFFFAYIAPDDSKRIRAMTSHGIEAPLGFFESKY